MPESPSLDALPDAALLLDAAGVVQQANGLMIQMFGGDIAGAALAERVDPPVAPAGDDAGPRAWRVEALRTDGVPFAADARLGPRDWAPGLRLVLLRRLDAAALLSESQRFLAAAFETAPIGMAFFNPDGEYVRVNPALCAMLGRREEELLGRRDQEFTHPDDRQSDVDAAWRILRGEIDSWQTEKRFVAPDGAVVHVIANLSFLRDDAGHALTWVGQFQNITKRRQLEDQLRRLADEDPLTGLPNRRHLEREIVRALELSARHGTRGALLLVDLDGFKAVNDTHGHATGDAALAAVAQAMRRRLRATDVLARVGGDEFAVLLPLTGRERAEDVARALDDEVRATRLDPAGPAIALRASVGVAELGSPEGATTPDALLAAADAAMYRSKRGSAGV